MASAHIALSSIARDPVVAAFLARGERDHGNAFALPVAPGPFIGSAGASMHWRDCLVASSKKGN